MKRFWDIIAIFLAYQASPPFPWINKHRRIKKLIDVPVFKKENLGSYLIQFLKT
jgi:hypothetical protein